MISLTIIDQNSFEKGLVLSDKGLVLSDKDDKGLVPNHEPHEPAIPNYSKLQLIHRWFVPARGVSPHLHPGVNGMGRRLPVTRHHDVPGACAY